MLSAVIELTNRCNLRCDHCAAERHAGDGDLPLKILRRLLDEGQQHELRHLSFTGGEPTVHRQFADVVRLVADAGYHFSLVSNGMNFGKVYSTLLAAQPLFTGVTFSLDGAREKTHDSLRGSGSYRRVLKAATICVAREIPFQFNMVLTRHNRDEVEGVVDLATQLGARGVQFGQLMFNPEVDHAGLALGATDRRRLEERIRRLSASTEIYVGLAPGYYDESSLVHCGPLQLREFNVDFRGNVTLCCHLPGHFGSGENDHVVGNLDTTSLSQALQRLGVLVERYVAEKQQKARTGALTESDRFPCWYCVKYLRQGREPGGVQLLGARPTRV